MWPENTGVPRSLKRSRNQGLTLPRPELVTESTGMNFAHVFADFAAFHYDSSTRCAQGV
jgi:hypothetical protein